MSDSGDVARKALFNGEGELRSGWRVLAFAVLLVVALTLISTFVAGLGALIPQFGYYLIQPNSTEGMTARALVFYNINQVISLAAALISSAIAARTLERRSLASIGFKIHKGWLRDFSAGSIIGAASLACAVAISFAWGATRFDMQTTSGADVARNFTALLIFFLIAAAFEEIIFRGFAFQALVHNLGPAPALAFTSVFFGLAHLSNNGATTFSTINTILAGVWLGIAYLKTRSLWLATALHYSWNLTMVFVFGLPVSGENRFVTLAWLKGQGQFPAWISGGEYGPEGGAAVTIVVILASLLIWKIGFFSMSDDMLEATRHGQFEQKPVSITREIELSQRASDNERH